MDLQFMTDRRGKKTAVVIPLKEWKKIEAKFTGNGSKRLSKSGEKFFTELRQAWAEMNAVESGMVKGKSLKQLIDEL
jgi:hypothetical protein